MKADLSHSFPAVQWVTVINTGLSADGGSYGRHATETGRSMCGPGFPSVDDWSCAERTDAADLKH